LAGIAALYSIPLFTNVGHLEYAGTILACLAAVVTAPVYLLYWKGPWLREKSKFAQSLAEGRRAKGGHRLVGESDEERTLSRPG
jgi:hypothetical protein